MSYVTTWSNKSEASPSHLGWIQKFVRCRLTLITSNASLCNQRFNWPKLRLSVITSCFTEIVSKQICLRSRARYVTSTSKNQQPTRANNNWKHRQLKQPRNPSKKLHTTPMVKLSFKAWNTWCSASQRQLINQAHRHHNQEFRAKIQMLILHRRSLNKSN